MIKIITLSLLILSLSASVFSQQNKSKSKTTSKDKKTKILTGDVQQPMPAEQAENPEKTEDMPEDTERIQNDEDIPAEKSIKVDSRVLIYVQVAEGNVRINGWNRDEVRAYVEDGSGVGFQVLKKAKENGKPNVIKVLGYDPDKTPDARPQENVFGKRIEIDVPYESILNFKGGDSNISADSISKVSIENGNGDISLSNIKYAIKAIAHQGDVLVQNSGGPIELNAPTGNITVSEVEPSNIDDFFKAKTNSGIISLKSISHTQVQVNSLSGMQRFESPILSGGQYNFTSSNGQIYLFMPKDTSCSFTAFYGYGRLKSDFQMKDLNKDVTPEGQRLRGKIGTGEGDAILNLYTNQGLISLTAKPK